MDIITGAITSFVRAQKCCCFFPPGFGIQLMALLAIISSSGFSIWAMVENPGGDKSNAQSKVQWINLYVLLIIVNIMNIIIHCLLIMGVRQNKPSLMFPSICVDFTWIIVFFSTALSVFMSLSFGAAFGIFLGSLPITFLFIHLFFIIYWYYEDLRSQHLGGV